MTTPRGDNMQKCGSTDAQRLSPNIPPTTTKQKRQTTSKGSAKCVKNEHMVTYNTITDTDDALNGLLNPNKPLVSSNAHDASCCEPPRVVADAPVAWHGGFLGGAGIGSHDYDTSPNRKVRGRSECGETDAVVSVHDLGLSAGPWSTHHSRTRRPSQSDIFEHISRKGLPTKPVHSAAEIEAEIRHQMESNLSWSEMDQEEFLPVDSFEKIFNIETVISLIRNLYQDATHEELILRAGQIWGDDTGSRRRIVATLVFMKQTSRIEDFIQEDIFDHHLPLRHKIKSKKEFRTLVDERDNTTLFQNWERVNIDLFYVYQRMIFVPFLSMGDGTLRSYVFDRNVRLPWDEFEHEATGGHGTVHRMVIHPSHHDYRGDNVRDSYLFCLRTSLIIFSKKPERPLCFAVKEINGADHESYRKELRALEQSCAKVQKEKHLIKLLLTFQHGNKPYLVFEWADGNLEQFWKRRQVETSPPATQWMAEQCRGIANAIKRIHGLATWQREERASGHQEAGVKDWGRHGDIKPTNILWFLTHGEDRDRLVVADLGLTRYHASLTKSRVMRVDGYTGTYRAPEIDLGSPISPKYDIWSLGCVFLEFCIWYLLGYEDVENFQRNRNLNRWSDDTYDIEEPDYSYFVTSHVPGKGKQAQLHPAVGKDHLQVPGSPTSLVSFAEGNSIIPDNIMSSVYHRDRALQDNDDSGTMEPTTI
ncbi:protein kinase domain-containing protein [Colletotrichum salicis]|uniref:Protein kinase domain-containing protein n=1 Tax=Colletotrichum salicis TaxID=1209931 RepID=A0A135UUB8_9PEZI|nr:protein kinase domain-containing protein [Colletotrichum salicis]